MNRMKSGIVVRRVANIPCPNPHNTIATYLRSLSIPYPVHSENPVHPVNSSLLHCFRVGRGNAVEDPCGDQGTSPWRQMEKTASVCT